MPRVPAQSFPHAWSRAKPALVHGGGLVVAGLGAVASDRLATVGWVTVASGVVITAALLLPLVLRVPMVAFDERGLRARLPGFGLVPWHDIERVRYVHVHNRKLLVVDRTVAARQRRRGGPLPRRLAQLAKANDLAAPLEGLTATPEQVVACVQLAHSHMTGVENPAIR